MCLLHFEFLELLALNLRKTHIILKALRIFFQIKLPNLVLPRIVFDRVIEKT